MQTLIILLPPSKLIVYNKRASCMTMRQSALGLFYYIKVHGNYSQRITLLMPSKIQSAQISVTRYVRNNSFSSMPFLLTCLTDVVHISQHGHTREEKRTKKYYFFCIDIFGTNFIM